MRADPEELELATIRFANGDPVPRTAAHRSFALAKRALAQAGGRPPRGPDGNAMVWNELRGWFPRDSSEDRAPVGHWATLRSQSRGVRTDAERRARHEQFGREIRQDRVNAMMGEERDLLRSATPWAWMWARQFSMDGTAPSLNSTNDKLVGWRIARYGYQAPPLWLRREQLARLR